MKKYIVIIVAVMCCNVFSQTKKYPFEVIKTGKGRQSIVFIPGFASSGDVWNETKSNFENDFTCYTLTMAGFAGVASQPNASFKNWETEIVNYILDYKLYKPIIVGHSMGGGLALAIAADYPDLITSIVVVDALPCLSAVSDPFFKSKTDLDCSPFVNQMTAMSNEQFYAAQKSMIARLSDTTEKQDAIVNWSVKSDRNTFGSMYCDFSNIDLREKITMITCPTLVLLEPYFLNVRPLIDSQYKNAKTAKLKYASKGLHFIMYDDKDFYLDQLKNFIKA
jgi:pimeloyl-ACP methyl ester carboxylesterase